MAFYVDKDLGQGTVTGKDYDLYCHYGKNHVVLCVIVCLCFCHGVCVCISECVCFVSEFSFLVLVRMCCHYHRYFDYLWYWYCHHDHCFCYYHSLSDRPSLSLLHTHYLPLALPLSRSNNLILPEHSTSKIHLHSGRISGWGFVSIIHLHWIWGPFGC